MGTIVPTHLSPLDIDYPTNGHWTIYGRSGPCIYAQPHFITYPLFVPIFVQGDILVHIGIDAIPDGVICNSLHTKSRYYRHLLKLLTNISTGKDYPFEREYKSVPFNDSHISVSWIVDSRRSEVKKGVESDIYWGSRFEDGTCSAVVLRNLWGFGRKDCRKELETGTGMPPVLPLERLLLRAWLHDTVTLVSIVGQGETLYAFKTNRSPQVLYEELYTLLSMPPHPHILERPSYLITKQTAHSQQYPQDPASLYFLEPTQPIIGFLAPYYSGGSLKSYIKNYQLTPKQQALWALQLTSALLHIYEYGGSDGKCGRYSALKMDNIVLDAAGNLRLIDFESAGTWVQYTPIEVMLAVRGKSRISRFMSGSSSSSPAPQAPGCSMCSPHPCTVPKGISECEWKAAHDKVLDYKYSPTSVLSAARPNSAAQYTGPAGHKKIPFWGDASDRECAAAMAWMLGCCLWCIFEDVPCLSRMGSDWFPVGSTLWGEAREKGVPSGVLRVVRRALQTRVERPALRELYEVMKEWEGAVRAQVVVVEEGEEEVR